MTRALVITICITIVIARFACYRTNVLQCVQQQLSHACTLCKNYKQQTVILHVQFKQYFSMQNY